MIKKIICSIIIAWGLSTNGYAAAYYVDGSVASSGNGQAWATAWKTLTDITGLSGDDTVYISGGSSYAVGSGWSPEGGTAGHPITYKIGQESGHNGTATFTCSTGTWLTPSNNNIIISGDAADENRHFVVAASCTQGIDSSSSPLVNVRVSYVDMGSSEDRMVDIRGSSVGFELDHSYLRGSLGTDGLLYMDFAGGSTYGQNQIHHNIFEVFRLNDGLGSDIVQGCDYADVYDNYFHAIYNASYSGGQHNDGIQVLGANYSEYTTINLKTS